MSLIQKPKTPSLLSVKILFLFTGFVFNVNQGFIVKPRTRLSGCSIDTNDGGFPSPDPLLIQPNVSHTIVADYGKSFYLPDSKNGILSWDEGQVIRIACPGSGNSIAFTKTSDELATCVGDDKFQIRNLKLASLGELYCESSPYHTAIEIEKCYNGYSGINIGFQLDKFYPLIYVCFDKDSITTIYSHEMIPSAIKGYESGADRPSFIEGGFYPDEIVNEMYSYSNQLDSFTKLLGSANLAKQYLKDQNNYFFARGHFSPRADFVFASHNRATFYYINAAPQWQIFNGGIWNNLELAVRDLAIDLETDLLVYTGPFGVLSLLDVNNNPTDLYLMDAGPNNSRLPIPKLYWKVVIDPQSKTGIAFVGVNNPYVSIPLPDDYKICDDVFDQIGWFNPSDRKWLYACEVNGNFSETVNVLPDFDISGLLTG